jgi:hypothetical protein
MLMGEPLDASADGPYARRLSLRLMRVPIADNDEGLRTMRTRLLLTGQPIDESDPGLDASDVPLPARRARFLVVRERIHAKDAGLREMRARLPLVRAPIDPNHVSFGAVRTRLVLIVPRIDEKDGRIRGRRTRLPLIRGRLRSMDGGLSKTNARVVANEYSLARTRSPLVLVMWRFHLTWTALWRLLWDMAQTARVLSNHRARVVRTCGHVHPERSVV